MSENYMVDIIRKDLCQTGSFAMANKEKAEEFLPILQETFPHLLYVPVGNSQYFIATPEQQKYWLSQLRRQRDRSIKELTGIVEAIEFLKGAVIFK